MAVPSTLRVIVALAMALALWGCSTWSPKPTAWSNATGAEQFERLLWQDVQQKNWSDVEQHLASTYIAQTSGATYDRDQALERLKQLEIAEYSLGEVQIHPDGDVVIVTYLMNLRGTMQGQPLELKQVRMMSVWQQQKRGWSAIAHTDSPQ